MGFDGDSSHFPNGKYSRNSWRNHSREWLTLPGKTVTSLKASKSFSTVLISSPDNKDGEKYTIKVGSNSTTTTTSKQAANSRWRTWTRAQTGNLIQGVSQEVDKADKILGT